MARKYPLTYEEYEKRLTGLFIGAYPLDKRELIAKRLDKFLSDDPYFIRGLYNDSCFDYDHPEIYGEVTKKTFTDEQLEAGPLQTLHMLLGGNLGGDG
jgi:hypothetical protein